MDESEFEIHAVFTLQFEQSGMDDSKEIFTFMIASIKVRGWDRRKRRGYYEFL